MATEFPTQEEVNEVANKIKEMNEFLSQVLPTILPEVEKFLSNCAPVADMLHKYLFSGKTFDSIIVMGNASYLARALLQNGMNPDEAAEKAVACAQKIVELSRK